MIEQALRDRGVTFESSHEQGVALRIPAKNEDVGDLKLSVDEDEIIVWVGPPENHSHFDQFSLFEDVPPEDQNAAIAEAAAEFIADMLEDRVVIEILRKDGKAREVTTYRLPYAKLPRRTEREGVSVERYVWSGAYGGNGS